MSQYSGSSEERQAGPYELQTRKSLEFDGLTYILASSLLAEHRVRVLKHEEAFAVFDSYGEVVNTAQGEEGLYYRGTRYAGLLEFGLGKVRPLLLSSTITGDNLLLTIDLTNPDMADERGRELPRGSVHIFKAIFLYGNSCYERVKITSYTHRDLLLPVSYRFSSDFKDIFEIRGHGREQRGELKEPEWKDNSLFLRYVGLDGVRRTNRITVDADPLESIKAEKNGFDCVLSLKNGSAEIFLCQDFLSSETEEEAPEGRPGERYRRVFREMEKEVSCTKFSDCRVKTTNESFNQWLNRSHSDLRMMISHTEHGPYPYAGVPWFSTTFGRDGVITALQTLWVNPDIARGVLKFLADTQATELSAERDSEPGKILHEARLGEMANLGEIPYKRYYGTVDATPLFVVLAGEHAKATGDLEFVRSIWPQVERALEWIDQYGDADGDGFVEYARRSKNGLVSQGWKDSADSIFHRDGRDAEPPVALCEVQGYVYQAKVLASELSFLLGKGEQAERLKREAVILQEKFHKSFWCEEIGTYALALDGNKRQCKVVASNAGHCLYSGIVPDSHASRVIDRLMEESSFCGWGLRTVAEGEFRYNPMSYHNGSVWPHDTSLIAMGFSRYGRKSEACRLLTGMFEASSSVDLNRLPELFCGFHKRPGQGPTLYPMSCAPQAWAAGAVFFLLQACLGLKLDALGKRILFESPCLPDNLRRLSIHGLSLGVHGSVDLEIVRRAKDVGLHLLRRKGELSVVAVQ